MDSRSCIHKDATLFLFKDKKDHAGNKSRSQVLDVKHICIITIYIDKETLDSSSSIINPVKRSIRLVHGTNTRL